MTTVPAALSPRSSKIPRAIRHRAWRRMVKRYTVPNMTARPCPFQGAQPCSRTPDPFRCSPQRMAGTAPPRLGAGKIHVRLAQFPCDLLSYRVKCLRTVAVKCGECWASAHRPQTAACRPRSDAVPAPIPPVTIMYARGCRWSGERRVCRMRYNIQGATAMPSQRSVH